MKMKLMISIIAILLLCSSSSLYGAVLVYEGFGDALTDTTLVGYSGTSAELGLTGAWAVPAGGAQATKARTPYEYVGISGGYTPDTVGSKQHWWEHNNNWSCNRAGRSLSSSINMTVDGTWYMSFFSNTGKKDYVAQMGLNDGTNELMWGNGYSGSSTKGLTAYYGAVNSSVQTNANGTYITGFEVSPYQTGFYVAKLVKTNSGTTNNLTVSIKFYNLGTPASPTNTIDNGDPAAWTRVVSLTGVSAIFNTLELKLDGGGSNWPSMDEIRIGQSWADVTVGNVQLITPYPSGKQYVLIDTNLQWVINNGWSVNVYLSNPYTDPNSNPVLSQVSTQNSTGLYNPNPDLAYNKWYYWRLDELEPNGIGFIAHTGAVWSFKTVGQDPIVNAVTPSVIAVDGDGTQSAVFSVTGVNVTGYQWYKKGSPDTLLTNDTKYAGVTTSSLTINTVGLADEGYYYCVVSNPISPNTASNRDTGPGRLMTKRLVIHYPLDTVVSGKTPDVVSGFDMTLVSDGGGADFPTLDTTNKKIGTGAMAFGNSNSADPNNWGRYATAGDADVEAMGNGFTVEFWMTFAGGNGTTGGIVVRRNSWASGQMMWGVEITNAGGLYIATGGNSSASTAVTPNTWVHVAITHDGNSTAKVYLNGEYKIQATNVPYWGGVDSPLMLGASNYNATTGLATNFFNGSLDDVKFYNFVKSTAQIAQDYLAVNGGWVCNKEVTALTYDFDGNCMVDLGDLALLAADWLNNNRVY